LEETNHARVVAERSLRSVVLQVKNEQGDGTLARDAAFGKKNKSTPDSTMQDARRPVFYRRMIMEYTAKQKEYIDSVEANAHQSAVRIIGELEAELAEARKKPEPTDPIVRTLIQGLRNEIDRLEAENKAKDEKARLFRLEVQEAILEVQEAIEALIGGEDDKSLKGE